MIKLSVPQIEKTNDIENRILPSKEYLLFIKTNTPITRAAIALGI